MVKIACDLELSGFSFVGRMCRHLLPFVSTVKPSWALIIGFLTPPLNLKPVGRDEFFFLLKWQFYAF